MTKIIGIISRHRLLALATVVTVGLILRGAWTYRAGIRGSNYALAFGEILAVGVYGLLYRDLRQTLESRWPVLREYLAEKPGAPYIVGFIGLLLIAALWHALQFPFVTAQVANISYFMLVWGVLLELRAAIRERRVEPDGDAGDPGGGPREIDREGVKLPSGQARSDRARAGVSTKRTRAIFRRRGAAPGVWIGAAVLYTLYSLGGPVVPKAGAESILVDGGIEPLKSVLTSGDLADSRPVVFSAREQGKGSLDLLPKVNVVLFTQGPEALALHIVKDRFRVDARKKEIQVDIPEIYEVWHRPRRGGGEPWSISIDAKPVKLEAGHADREDVEWVRAGEVQLGPGRHLVEVKGSPGERESDVVLIPRRVLEEYRNVVLDAIQRSGVVSAYLIGSQRAGVGAGGAGPAKQVRLPIPRDGEYVLRAHVFPVVRTERLLFSGPPLRFEGVTKGKADLVGPGDSTRSTPAWGISGLVIAMPLSGRAEDTERAHLEWSFPRGVDIQEYPYVRFGVLVGDRNVQTLAALFGIDATGDGRVDGYVSAVPTIQSRTGEIVLNLNLLEAAKERFRDDASRGRRDFRLVRLVLIPQKQWGVDASGERKGVYRFHLDELQIFTDRSMTLPGPPANLREARLVGNQGGVGESSIINGVLRLWIRGTADPTRDQYGEDFLRRSAGQLVTLARRDGAEVTGTVGQVGEGFVHLRGVKELGGKEMVLSVSDISKVYGVVEKLTIILKDGKSLTGVLTGEDPRVIRLARVNELEGRDAEVERSNVASSFRILEKDAATEIILDPRNLGSSIEVSVPLDGRRWGSHPYLTLEYGIEGRALQHPEVWLEVRDSSGRTRKVFAGRPLPIDRQRIKSARVDLDRGRAVQTFEFFLGRAFPEAYTTRGGSGGRFVVLKDGQPIGTTWGSWQVGGEQVEIGSGNPRRVLLSVPVTDHPLRHEYVVRYLLPEWRTERPTDKRFHRITIDLREALGGLAGEIVSVSLVLHSRPGESAVSRRELGEASPFILQEVEFAHRLPFPGKSLRLGDTELVSLLERPLVKIDGKAITLRSRGDPRRLLDREGAWLEPVRVPLTEGAHTIELLPHPTFKLDLLVEPGTRPSEPQPPGATVEFRRINPTRYEVSVDGKEPFWLVLSESFDEGWKAYVKQGSGVGDWGLGKETGTTERWSALWSAWKDRGKRVPLNDHFTVNGYANAWYVPKTGQYTITLEFWPQRLFELGLLISGFTLLGCFSYLGYDVIKRRSRRNRVP